MPFNPPPTPRVGFAPPGCPRCDDDHAALPPRSSFVRFPLTLIIGLAGPILATSARAGEPPRFEFRDGDRVVLIGDTLIERDQEYGYLETLLTAANPDKTIIFRNLGWSGDTVGGLSRA